MDGSRRVNQSVSPSVQSVQSVGWFSQFSPSVGSVTQFRHSISPNKWSADWVDPSYYDVVTDLCLPPMH